jgi:hypothetical protein
MSDSHIFVPKTEMIGSRRTGSGGPMRSGLGLWRRPRLVNSSGG